MKKIIAVTIGDIEGVGIEILIRIWEKKKYNNFLLITNYNLFNKYLKKINKKIKIKKVNQIINKLDKLDYKNFINVFDIKSKNNIENSYNSLIESYKLVKSDHCIGILNLPINKEKIFNKIDKKFIGQTELYAKLDNKKNVNMTFIYKKIIFVTLTTHVSLKNIHNFFLKNNYIFNKILRLNHTLKKDFKYNKPKLIIAGINPHAGENGVIGLEEVKILRPIINKLKKNNIYINGPYSADSLINKSNLNNYHCFIFNYHDQALIPFKLISNNKGINYTSGLDIIRVSPDHGTAYDIVGSKIAKLDSVLNCFKFISKISKNRNSIVHS